MSMLQPPTRPGQLSYVESADGVDAMPAAPSCCAEHGCRPCSGLDLAMIKSRHAGDARGLTRSLQPGKRPEGQDGKSPTLRGPQRFLPRARRLDSDDIRGNALPSQTAPRASRHHVSCSSIHAYVRESIPGETVVFEHSRGPQSAGLQYSKFHDDDAK